MYDRLKVSSLALAAGPLYPGTRPLFAGGGHVDTDWAPFTGQEPESLDNHSKSHDFHTHSLFLCPSVQWRRFEDRLPVHDPGLGGHAHGRAV